MSTRSAGPSKSTFTNANANDAAGPSKKRLCMVGPGLAGSGVRAASRWGQAGQASEEVSQKGMHLGKGSEPVAIASAQSS